MKIEPIVVAYAIVAIIALTTLWQWHRNETYENFSLLDLIAEDGRLSSRKFMEFGTWVVMTVAFVKLVEADKLTEWYVIAYGGLFIGARIGGQILHKKDG